MSKLSLNEIRAVQSLSIKKRIAFSNVPDKDKKVFRQLKEKGIVQQNGQFWELVAKN